MSSGLRKIADTAPIVNYGKLSDGLNLALAINFASGVSNRLLDTRL